MCRLSTSGELLRLGCVAQTGNHVFADDGIHWHIIPLGSVPQFNGLVISAGEDV
jgi:hypothetical protein